MTESIRSEEARPRARRGWLILTTIGCALIVMALIVTVLVIADKPRFGWLVGSAFLPIIASGVLFGGIAVLAGAWNLPIRKTWRWWVLLAWGLVALTSPAFGIMFLLPWAVLAAMLPVVVAILIRLFRTPI